MTFRRLNLLADARKQSPLPPMDVAFCRNVLIYMTADGVQAAARRLVAGLAPGGWLVTGTADPPLEDVPELETVRTPAGFVYRRAVPSVAQPAAPEPRPAARASASSLGKADPDRATGTPNESPPVVGTDPLQPAREALERGDYELAEELAERAAQSGLGGSEAHTVIVRALANQGRTSEAVRRCEVAAARFPVAAEVRYLQSLALLEDSRPAEAARAARAAVYLRSDLAVAHLALGRAESSVGNRKEAARAFRNAAHLLRALPPDQPVPLAEGETAGRLATMVDDPDLTVAEPRPAERRSTGRQL